MKNDYEIRGDEVLIYLKRRKGNPTTKAIISLEDLPRVNEIPNNWFVDTSYWENIDENYYVGCEIDGKRFRMHRWIMQPSEDLLIDHINHHGWDNRRENLRIVTPAQNSQNFLPIRKINTSSGFRGVKRCPRTGNWSAEVRVQGTFYWLGNYRSKEEAILVAMAARAQLMPYSPESQIKELLEMDISAQLQGRKLPVNNTTGTKGIKYDARYGTWSARINKNRKTIHLGSFKTKEEAIGARLMAESKLKQEVIGG